MLRQSGVTLVEIILVVSVFSIITGLSASEYSKFRAQTQLKQSAYQLEEVLQMAQNQAMYAENGTTAGVCFSNDGSYDLVNGSSCKDIESTYHLLGTVGFSAIHLPADKVIFNKLTGMTAESGSIKIKHPQFEQELNIRIESNGLINIE